MSLACHMSWIFFFAIGSALKSDTIQECTNQYQCINARLTSSIVECSGYSACTNTRTGRHMEEIECSAMSSCEVARDLSTSNSVACSGFQRFQISLFPLLYRFILWNSYFHVFCLPFFCLSSCYLSKDIVATSIDCSGASACKKILTANDMIRSTQDLNCGGML